MAQGFLARKQAHILSTLRGFYAFNHLTLGAEMGRFWAVIKMCGLFKWTLVGSWLLIAEATLPLRASGLEARPTIHLAFEDRQPWIYFNGVLWAADQVEGPWSMVEGAESPFALDAANAQKYFRAGPLGTNSIFEAHTLVSMGLSGPMQGSFELAHAGTPDGIIPPVRLKPYFDGTLTLPGWTLPATIRVRGNSSLQECPFPKLKFKIAKADRAGTPFADAKEVKIGTHCAEGGRGSIGRLREQSAVYREVLAYEALELMGLAAPRIRRVEMDYLDTTPATNDFSVVGWQVTRDALIVEDGEVLAARLGARLLAEEEAATLALEKFDLQLTADLQCFETLLGNWDYDLGWGGRNVWNFDVLEFTTGSLTNYVPVAGDFDLASWVTGVVRRSAPWEYHPELGDLERETRYSLEQARQRVGTAVFNVTRQRFNDRKAALETLVNYARIDDDGRTNVQQHISVFYDALSAL